MSEEVDAAIEVMDRAMDDIAELRSQLAAKDAEIARLRDEYLYLRELFLIARPLLKNVGDILDQRILAACSASNTLRREGFEP